MRPPRELESKGRRNIYMKEQTDFPLSTNFTLLSRIKGDSTNTCDFFETVISVRGRPLRLLAPGAAKTPSYTTATNRYH